MQRRFVLARMGQALLELAFPVDCLGCKQRLPAGQALCPACYKQVGWLKPPFCLTCGEPDFACGGHPRPGPLNGVWAWAWHEGLLAGLIGRFKYDKQYALHAGLIRLMRHNPLGWEHENFDILAPVPLHAKRLKSRGFNQAALLAKGLRHKGLALDLLFRMQDKPPQVGLSRRERKENVKGIFALNQRYNVNGKSVLLLDDVWTTGATMVQCATVLIKAGARRVGALTVTRAPLEKD